MPDGQPPRGASAVNDEFEVGYDFGFEQRWERVEIVGRCIMGLVVALGLSGLLGRGPFSHEKVSTADAALISDYEPIARWKTPTQVTLHLQHPPGTPNSMVVRLSSTFAEPMGLQLIQPRPLAEMPDGRGIALSIAVPKQPGAFLLRISLLPTGVGPVHLYAETGTAHLGWTQVILP